MSSRHTLEMVQMADEGGFAIAWAAEHHALEMTIAPNPVKILTWWAAHTSRIRLGSAVVVAAYWHPLKAAARLRCWIYTAAGSRVRHRSGAYQREFDRMHPGLQRNDGFRYMFEMLPVVKALWQGDYEHEGEFWSFPTATSVPEAVTEAPSAVWIAARSPDSYEFAVKHECNILSWPLTRPMSEVELYMERLDTALANNPGKPRPIFATMRHTVVYDRKEEWEVPVKAAIRQFGQFENLFKNLGDVADGFPRAVELSELENRDEYDPNMLHHNLLFGTPEEVTEKLRTYEALGVDHFTYYASLGLGMKEQKRSLELFIKEVMPAFA